MSSLCELVTNKTGVTSWSSLAFEDRLRLVSRCGRELDERAFFSTPSRVTGAVVEEAADSDEPADDRDETEED